MIEKKENFRAETDMAFALASILLNLLIFLVLCGCMWVVYSLMAKQNTFGLFLSEIAGGR